MLTKGMSVIVRDAWKYSGKFLGVHGTVNRLYMPKGHMSSPQVAIEFDDIKNPDSSDGCFWFPLSNVSSSAAYQPNRIYRSHKYKPREKQEDTLIMMKTQLFGGKIAKIKFPDGTNKNTTYAYALYDDFQPGDTVVVQTGHHGKAVAVIDSIIDEKPVNVSYGREVICRVDTSAYDERQKKAARVQELKFKMDKRVQELKTIAVYQMMAEKDSEMRELLSEYTTLSGSQDAETEKPAIPNGISDTDNASDNE